MHGKDDHTCLGVTGDDAPENLKAPNPIHGQVEHDDIGAELFDQRPHLRAIPGLTDHLQVLFGLEHDPKTLAHDGLVLD